MNAIDAAGKVFKAGSLVAVPRKTTDATKHMWVAIEAIDDAHAVSPAEVRYPVIMARLTSMNADNGAVDNRYHVHKDAKFYFIVSPDSYDGSVDDQSRWDMVEMTTVGTTPKGRIVAAGVGYHPCKNDAGENHPQKGAPFGWFVDCKAANGSSFEMLMYAKSARDADPDKKAALLRNVDENLKASLRLAVENDEPIWITCGLGCCST